MRRISQYLRTENPLALFLARLGIFRRASSIPPERLSLAIKPRSLDPVQTPFTDRLVASGGPVSPAIQAARVAFGHDPAEDLYADSAARAQAAVATLQARGWTWHGGVQWRPPLGTEPEYVTRAREEGRRRSLDLSEIFRAHSR